MSLLDLEPVEKIPADIKAAEILRNSIVTGIIMPGARITEQNLSKQLQVSRATIRLALYQLSAEGLVVLTPYTGWSVSRLTSQDAWELSTLRAALERMGCIVMTEALTDETADELKAAYERFVTICKTKSPNEASLADFELHTTIIKLSGNNRLKSLYAQVESQTRMFILSSNELVETSSAIIEQHRPIIKAILSGQARKAGDLMEQHNIEEGKKLIAHLRALENQAQNVDPTTE